MEQQIETKNLKESLKYKSLDEEATEMILILEQFKNSLEINNKEKSYLLKLDKLIISKFIIPFLGISDIISLRSTSRELNFTVNSTMTIASYIKNTQKFINNKKSNTTTKSTVLKSFNEIKDIEDVNLQIETLVLAKEKLISKLQSAENYIKLLRTDMSYLKNQLAQQTKHSQNLNENLSSYRLEMEKYKEENSILKNNCLESSKKMKENTLNMQQENEQLHQKIDKLNYEVDTLKHSIYKLNKSKEDIESKNINKAYVLKSIKNYIETSEIFKLANLSELDKLDTDISSKSGKLDKKDDSSDEEIKSLKQKMLNMESKVYSKLTEK